MFRVVRSLFAKKVDVCVLGGGPAGIAAALRAHDFGKTSCIVESSRIGGADLWNGALQSKTMWEMAKFAKFSTGQSARRFVKPTKELPELKNEHVQRGIRVAAETREAQILKQLNAVDIAIIPGSGAFVDANTVSVSLNDNGGEETVEADYFVIASGARPRPHATAIADGKVVFTSDDIMNQPFPKSIVIIGAGVIGCEFASIYANIGKTKVNIIEKSSRILPMEDEDVALFVQHLLEEKGVNFHHHSQLVDNAVRDNKFHYMLKDLRDGSSCEHVVDAALVSIGRVPNLESLQLDRVGVEVKNGRISRDSHLRIAPHKHIYACGDVCTRAALVNVGEAEGRACIEHMYATLPEDQLAVKLDNLSTIMFLDVEVASVGLNEQDCRKRNIAYKTARYGYEFVSRALAMGNTRGFVKLVVTNDEKMQVLGVRAAGPHASSIIELASLAIHNKESAYNLSELRTAYPAITEGFQECLHMLLGTSTMKPNVLPGLVLKEWSPSSFSRGRAYAEQS